VDGDEVTIGYPETASMALDRMRKEDSLRLVAGVCADVIGQPVRLRVVELREDDPAGVSAAQARAAKERAGKQALLEHARAHPLVKQALEIFGGDVIEVRQVPPRKEVR
jgi:DNA polymerase-3 subunit gamma/tau